MNASRIKKDFPIFSYHKKLVYLDNASTTQTPRAVLDAMNFYYEQRRANIHRGTYQLSGLATQLYEESRDTVAGFLHAFDTEIVFTSGTTHGLNLLAYTLGKDLQAGDNVVLTRMEHHANLVPWIQLARQYGFELRFIELVRSDELGIRNYELDLERAKKVIDEKTKIVSFCHISNTLGTLNPAKNLISMAKTVGAITIVDAAQTAAHRKLDVKELDCDFLVFSGHKMYGPTGIGVLYGKRERLEKLSPFFFGGDMIKEVDYESVSWNDLPWKFEGGTPNIAGAIGLAAAVRFINHIGFKAIQTHERQLTDYARQQLQQYSNVTIIGSKTSQAPVISFTVEGVHPHDVAQILDHHGIAVRAGHHCTMPLMNYLGLIGTTRVSFGVYNSKNDVDCLIKGLIGVNKIFKF